MGSQSKEVLRDAGGRTIPNQYYDSSADAYRLDLGNTDLPALLTMTAASSGSASADQTNLNGRGAQIGVNITALTGTAPTLTVVIEGKDAASGTYYPLLQSVAIAATGFTQMTVYPGLTAAANVASIQPLPRVWRVRTIIGGVTPAVTATVGASVII